MSYNETGNTYSPASGASNSLTAFFDSRAEAEKAVKRLQEAGISHDAIRLVPGYEADNDTSAQVSDDRKGFWASLGDFFFPDEDRLVYSEGLRRGGFLVSVSSLGEGDYSIANDVLDDEGSIDLDERADLWRSEGWNDTASTSTAAASSYDRNLNTLGTAGEDAFAADTTDDNSEVVEENLRVGKRDVNARSGRVRAYTVDTPVSEDVSLRDEDVTITRRSVDRPLTDADEAVVSKEARVVEEIGFKKSATECTETVNESVRKTEAEIDDERVQKQDGFSQSQGFKRD